MRGYWGVQWYSSPACWHALAQVYLRLPTPEITTKEVLAQMLAQIPEDVRAVGVGTRSPWGLCVYV